MLLGEGLGSLDEFRATLKELITRIRMVRFTSTCLKEERKEGIKSKVHRGSSNLCEFLCQFSPERMINFREIDKFDEISKNVGCLRGRFPIVRVDDRKADTSLLIHIGMINWSLEGDSWGLEGILFWEDNLDAEGSGIVRNLRWNNQAFPNHHVGIIHLETMNPRYLRRLNLDNLLNKTGLG